MLTQKVLDALSREIPKSQDDKLRETWSNVLRCLRAAQQEKDSGRVETQLYLFKEYWKEFVQMAAKVPELAKIVGDEELRGYTPVERATGNEAEGVSMSQFSSRGKTDSSTTSFYSDFPKKGEVAAKQPNM